MASPVLGILGQAAPGAATNGNIYTVPTATPARRAVISSICVCNTSATQTTFRIFARVGGAAAAVGNAIAYDVAIAGNSTVFVQGGITLAATDILTGQSVSGAVTFTAFGNEEDVPTS